MVQPTVDDEERTASRHLPVDHPRQVNPTLTDQVSTKLYDDLDLRQRRSDPVGEHLLEVGADGSEVEGRILGEVRDAEAAAEVQVADLCGRGLGESQQQFRAAALRFAQQRGVEIL